MVALEASERMDVSAPDAVHTPESGVLHCRRLLADKRFHDALRCSARLLAAYPDAPEVIHCRSDILFRLLRFDEAIDMLERAVPRHEDSTLYEDLVKHCMQTQRTDVARRACVDGLSRFPGNVYLLKALYDIDSARVEANGGGKRRRGLAGRMQRIFAKLLGAYGPLKEWQRFFAQAVAIPDAVQGFGDYFPTKVLRSFSGNSPEGKRVAKCIRVLRKLRGKWVDEHDPGRVVLPETPGLPKNATLDAVFRNNALMYRDVESVRCNVRDGSRVVVNQPSAYEYTVFLVGHCMTVHGWCDSVTLGSVLQDVFNARTGGKVRVVCYGGAADIGERHNTYLQLLHSGELRPGDKVLCYDLSPGVAYGTSADRESFSGLIADYAMIRNDLAGMGAALYVGFAPVLPRDAFRTRPDEALYRALCELRRMPSREESEAVMRTLAGCLEEKGIVFSFFDSVLARKPQEAGGKSFWDGVHYSQSLNGPLAEAMYDFLSLPSEVKHVEGVPEFRKPALDFLQNVAFTKFLENRDILSWIAETRDEGVSSRDSVGAIVMNCNPFTLGHRYLVEQALEQVDALYLFVVEENLSQFSFADRLMLVREGVRDLGDRVHVVPSGKFIISSFSFAGYFTKAVATKPADSTTDLLIFAAMIAPALNIQTRFVGEEPNCLVTRAYNERMEQLLPDMGCAVRVIPRKESGGAVISASRVRKALEDGDLESIRNLVPETTYNYLQNTLVNT